MSLKNSETDDLINRWNMLFEPYLQELKELKSLLIKINKKRNELLLIREELVSRNIEPDGEVDVDAID